VSVLREIRARLELFGERVPLDFIHGLVMLSIFAEDKEPRIQITKPQRVEELLKVVENLEELIVI
jgi:hypothetical protein